MLNKKGAIEVFFRVFGLGGLTVLIGVLELFMSKKNIFEDLVRNSEVNILSPFFIAVLIVGFNRFVYKKVNIVKITGILTILLIGMSLCELVGKFFLKYSFLFVNIREILIMGVYIVFFSFLCYVFGPFENKNKIKS